VTPHRLVRPARIDDIEPLIELARRAWLSAFAQTAPFALIAWWAASDRTRGIYEREWAEMLVLEEDGTAIGLVQPEEAEINGLWVRPDRQRTGAGTMLLRAGEAAIGRAGHTTAWLVCSAFNTDALAFYRRRGYVETGRDRYVHESGLEIEDVRLEKRLDAA
jgi:[ribosomal protein S18]-alanine N-acetyltransferase